MNQCSHCGKFRNLYMDSIGNFWCGDSIAEEYGYIKDKEEVTSSH